MSADDINKSHVTKTVNHHDSTHLSGRHFLRGIGTTMALPLLDAMIPLRASAAAAAASKPRRSVFVYIPNGVNGMTWQCKQSGNGYDLSPSLKPLEHHRDDFTVFSGLHQASQVISQ